MKSRFCIRVEVTSVFNCFIIELKSSLIIIHLLNPFFYIYAILMIKGIIPTESYIIKLLINIFENIDFCMDV